MVLDTNILIYATKAGGELMRRWLDDPDAIVSIVSRIESLGYTGLSDNEEVAILRALRSMPESGLTDTIATRSIALRRQKKMGLADAIIAATALAHDLPLVTRNVDDFKHIAGLKLINPFAAD